MRAAVVGAGIAGLFTAYYLERAGVDVTIFDGRPPGSRSVHAAGIIEPTTAYRTNTFAFLRRAWRYWHSGTLRLRGVDPGWLVESLRGLNRPAHPGAETAIGALGEFSFAEYERLTAARDDFGYEKRGLVLRYDDPRHFAEERGAALAQQGGVPVEVREGGPGAGALFFPVAGWLHTERFVARIREELRSATFVDRAVRSVTLDGEVATREARASFDAVAVCTGVTSRSLGLPLTAVRGFGWHLRSSQMPDVATIHVDSGVALVPLRDGLKATGGWDFDLASGTRHAARVLAAVRRAIPVDAVLDFNDGARPCTPDGLPIVGRKGRLVVANGGFRLGWSFGPALGRRAADLALGQADNDPFLARYCAGLRSGPLAG